MLLFYVRHGDPIYNPDSLTPLGHRQAEAVAKRLCLHGVDKVYASSSNRAILTSQPTCEMLKTEPEILDWCNEGYAWNDFAFENKNGLKTWCFYMQDYIEKFASAEVRDLGERWYEHPYFADRNFKGGIERIKRETYAFLADLGFEFDAEKGMYKSSLRGNKRVALFAHQGFGLLFLSAVLAIPYPTVCTRMDMTHTGVTVFEFPEKDGYVLPKALTLSNDSHIYCEGLPTKYNNEIYF